MKNTTTTYGTPNWVLDWERETSDRNAIAQLRISANNPYRYPSTISVHHRKKKPLYHETNQNEKKNRNKRIKTETRELQNKTGQSLQRTNSIRLETIN